MLAWTFVGVAVVFTFGLFYLTVNAQELILNLDASSEYVGEPIGSWEAAPDNADSFEGSDIQTLIVDGKLYMQIKSVGEDKAPYIDSLRVLENGNYLVYVDLEPGEAKTAVYELKIDADLDEGAPVVSQVVKGIQTEASETHE